MPQSLFAPETAVPVLSLPFDDEVVQAALSAAQAEARFANKSATDEDRARLLLRVARRFLVQRDVGSACRVLGAAPPLLRDRLPVQMLKMLIYSRMAEIEPLITELRAILQLRRIAPGRDQALSLNTSRMGLGWWLGGECKIKPALWGPLPEDPADWVREGAGEYINPPLPSPMPDNRVAPLLRIAGVSRQEAQTRFHAIDGPARREGFLFHADMKARLAPPGTPRAAEIVAYHDRYVREAIFCDMSPLLAARQAGRNAILLMAHAGSQIRVSKFAEMPGPKAVIMHAMVPRADTLWVSTLRDPTTVTLGFMKLARAIRKAPHLVILLPDGAAGTASTEVEVDGARFRVALGGAALARVAPSTLFFARSFHRDGKVELEITEGPQMGPGMDSAESDAQFAAFYASGLRRILHSPLEDIESFGFMRSIQGDEEMG